MVTSDRHNSQFVRMAAGAVALFTFLFLVGHASAALASGEIIAWGSNSDGQCNVPEPNAGFVAVEGGYLHSVGLKEDATVVAWGDNSRGQCFVPAPNAGFVAVSAKGYHSLALKDDGTIAAWGDNSSGQCDLPEPQTGYVAVAAGGHHSLALRFNGNVIAWGRNDYGQAEVPGPNGGFVAIAAGYYHNLGLKLDGSIDAWGSNEYGQCEVPEPNTGFVEVAAGGYYSLGLKSDGSILAWGGNAYGQGDVPEPNTAYSVVAGGGYHSLGMKQDGSVLAWGRNSERQCDLPAPDDRYVAVAAGGYHSLAIPGSLLGFEVADVPADQGGWLRASWNQHPSDSASDPLPIVRYEVEVRKVGIGWIVVAVVEASGADSYAVDFETSDILIVGGTEPFSRYRVVAYTEDPGTHFVSEMASAYSIDNLAPPQPQLQFFEFAYAVAIVWTINDIPDFAEACVYRGTTIDFVPVDPIICTTGIGYTEPLTTMVYFRVQFVDTHGNLSEFSEVVYPTSTDIADEATVPELRLSSCYPNPFNPRTTVEFTIPAAGRVTMDVYDVKGRIVARLVDDDLDAGNHRCEWGGVDRTGDPVPSGTYLCRLATPWGTESRTMTLVK
ncbi:MAG TPA: FlgD immunoglobulin-like domain containing protein [Candidatus Krumholzibacteria bacterium]|nr:FlgD immunoglobulin-like domain containing protein [Candidatus Krumholzibacteria bacterium]HPD70340.1 FlgD immunoglobulin-like domain containing protein [Candidatus Krumholzibacteria bacterium]HRY39960.1 FlgD immunoglobulin-like domain containing protein [Candidatus Krumholzibacteria bacterium]